jgi:hypothetical protein
MNTTKEKYHSFWNNCILSCCARSNGTGDIQSDANVEENANQRTFRDVTANVRRWGWNGRRPGTTGTESFFQNASSSFEISDVSEMAASYVSCATFSAIEQCLDAI